MTNEEAIKMLKSKVDGCTDTSYEWAETVRMAIKALEQKPCDDVISRAEAIKRFTYNHKGERIPNYDCDNFPVRIDIKTVKEVLRDLPSFTPQPKIGKWIGIEYDGYADGNPVYDVFECSLCGCEHKGESDTLTDYCPGCGAKMVDLQESEE